MAEELRFEKSFGERGAVDGDERLVRAGTVPVRGAGDQFLAGAALPTQQDRRVRACDARNAVEERTHRLARADHVVLEVDLGAQLFVAFLEAKALTPLFASDGGKRAEDHQQPDVTFVERRPGPALEPHAADDAPESHHGRDNRVSAIVGGTVAVDDECLSLAGRAVDEVRVDSHGIALGGQRPRRSKMRRQARVSVQRDCDRGNRIEHEARDRGVELRKSADRAQCRNSAQERRKVVSGTGLGVGSCIDGNCRPAGGHHQSQAPGGSGTRRFAG